MKLSRNFELDEFIVSQTATRLGIDNTPSPEVIQNLTLLVTKFLQPLRDIIGKPITVSSGYRSPSLNKAIGGSKLSQHIEGQACDFKISSVGVLEACRFIAGSDLPFDQLIYEGKWIHISYNKENCRRQILTAKFTNKGTQYLPGLVE